MSEVASEAKSHDFQAEVGKLLDIVTHALYSEREVFLRELISNAADACDRLRYAAIAEPSLLGDGGSDYQIWLKADEKAGTLTISDNGIGMSEADLISHLGTIARSGTGNFLKQLSEAQKDAGANLIGQFGVGFYAAFMVAKQVTVASVPAGSHSGHHWISDGRQGFSVRSGSRFGPFGGRGTDIVLELKDDAKSYLQASEIKRIVKNYSNHIPFPIRLEIVASAESQAQAKDDHEDASQLPEQINQASAPWTLAKDKVTKEQHKEFYRHCSHNFDEPWETIHFRSEGLLEFSGLLYIPSDRPFDLFNPERINRLRLYVRRVFITDHCEQLVPGWLRFLRGVVDSQDLPLNISREMLQNNPVIGRIRTNLVKRILDSLEAKIGQDESDYLKFWQNFGLVLKEGLCEPGSDKETSRLLSLCRFHSVKVGAEGWTSLADYKAAMKPQQKAIYYITGQDAAALARSPHVEGFKARGLDVLLLADTVDDFWVGYQNEFDGTPLQSITRAGNLLEDYDKELATTKDGEANPEADGDSAKKKSKASAKDKAKSDEAPIGEAQQKLESLTKALANALSGEVSKVVLSSRLQESPVCLVSGEFGPDLHLERILRQHNQSVGMAGQRVLEINPRHPLIATLANHSDNQDLIARAAKLLHNQARIVEGEAPLDPAQFAQDLTQLMLDGLGLQIT